MKLIKTWYDDYNKIENSVYELESGVNLAVSVNPSTTDFDLEITFKAGSYFESQYGFKDGTAHFLEHILAGNPNSIYKTKQQFEDFTHGDSTKASFFPNAHTSATLVSFDSHGHVDARHRMTDYLFAQINYPLDRIKEFIEKERKIIIGEINQKELASKSSALQYSTFFFSDYYPVLKRYILGTEEDVKSITEEDLKNYYNKFFNKKNSIISIQTPIGLDKDYINKLEEFTQKFLNGDKYLLQRLDIENSFRFKHHFDEKRSGIFMSINRFYKLTPTYDYVESVKNYFFRMLINEVTFRRLREEKHLVYSGGGATSVEGLNFKNYAFVTEFSKDRFAEVLDQVYELLYNEIPEFISSSESDIWFQGIVSRYIFDRNPEFEPDYASHISYAFINEVDYDYNFEKARDVARNITKSDVLEFYNSKMTPDPGFWFVSSIDEEEVYRIFSESRFFKS